VDKLELFHVIADQGSARVRKFIVDEGLRGIAFRNLHYDEVKQDFDARGGHVAPALWDGKTLVEGAEAVMARLVSLKGSSRS
jgi:hypothetical protein